MDHKILLGAVAYDPKVVTIWEGFRAWFATQGVDFDFVLYSNYEAQVSAHFRGHFDVAWNSPLAWIQSQAIAAGRGRQVSGFCMRDSDQDLRSLIVVRADSGIQSLQDLAGKRVGVGAADSPQATLIPLQHLAAAGVDAQIVEHDVLYGKHGDHIGGERDAAKALMRGEIDAACMIDGNHLLFSREGTLPAGGTRVLASTALYDHCIFTALDDVEPATLARFTELLLAQDYADPSVRHLLDLEGLKQWRPGRLSGFEQLQAAVDGLEYAGAQQVREFIQGEIAR